MCRQSTDYSFGNVSAIYRLLFWQCAGNIHIVWAMCRQSTGYFLVMYRQYTHFWAMCRQSTDYCLGNMSAACILVLAMCRQSTHYCLGNVSAITCCF